MRALASLFLFNFVMFIFGVAAAMPLAAQTPDLSGTWLSDSHGNEKWILEQKSGKIHVQEMDGDKVQANYTCSLDGTECEAKEDGHSEKITMYFNGTKLVKICERGSGTVKQRLEISADGKTLNVETVPLSSSQKAETVSFRRQTT
jgi:hypothetical protein